MQVLQQIMADHHTVIFARTFLALVLLIAGISKLGDRELFTGVVRAYGLLPEFTVSYVSRLLPLAEILVAVGLVSNLSATWPVTAAATLFFVFGLATSINLLRGRRDISCGCFGPNQGRELSWVLVLRNLGLVGLAILAYPASSAIERLQQLAPAEMIATMFTAGAALALWWLQGLIVSMWRLRLPIQSYSVSNRSRGSQKLFSLARAERR
jgi:uncharacterized membrane protein YphA (DoxX/SURF4 family)